MSWEVGNDFVIKDTKGQKSDPMSELAIIERAGLNSESCFLDFNFGF